MRLLKLFAPALVATLAVYGQTPSASVVGRVVDATGAVVPGVAIRIVNVDTNQKYTAASNSIGDYTVPYLNPGRYSLEADAQGFRTYKHGEFELEVGQTLRLDVSLQ